MTEAITQSAAGYGEIEAKCRKAFLLEDGYGIPGEHPVRYRIFRDGFFAAWMLRDKSESATAPRQPAQDGMLPALAAPKGGAQ